MRVAVCIKCSCMCVYTITWGMHPCRCACHFLWTCTHAILVPRTAILLACTTDRELWQGRKAGSLRITDFRLSAQPQKFETVTVTIGYKNGQLLRFHVILAPARAFDPWR